MPKHSDEVWTLAKVLYEHARASEISRRGVAGMVPWADLMPATRKWYAEIAESTAIMLEQAGQVGARKERERLEGWMKSRKESRMTVPELFEKYDEEFWSE